MAFIRLLARAKARSDPDHAKTCGTGLAVEVAVALGVRCGWSFHCFLAGIAHGPTPLSHGVEKRLSGCWACVVTQAEQVAVVRYMTFSNAQGRITMGNRNHGSHTEVEVLSVALPRVILRRVVLLNIESTQVIITG